MAYTATKISQLQSKSFINDTDVMVVSTPGINSYQSTVANVKASFKNSFEIDSMKSSILENSADIDQLSGELGSLSAKTSDLSDLQFVKSNKSNIIVLSDDVSGISSEITAFKSPNDTAKNTYHLIKTGFKIDASAKNYPIKLDANSNAYVNVPWQSGASGKTADEVSSALDNYKLSVDAHIYQPLVEAQSDIETLKTDVSSCIAYEDEIHSLSVKEGSLAANVYGYGFGRTIKSFSVNSSLFDEYISTNDNTWTYTFIQDSTLTDPTIGSWHGVGNNENVDTLDMDNSGITLILDSVYQKFYNGDKFTLTYITDETSPLSNTWQVGEVALVSEKTGDIGNLSTTIESLSNSLSVEEWTITYKDAEGVTKTMTKKLAMYVA